MGANDPTLCTSSLYAFSSVYDPISTYLLYKIRESEENIKLKNVNTDMSFLPKVLF